MSAKSISWCHLFLMKKMPLYSGIFETKFFPLRFEGISYNSVPLLRSWWSKIPWRVWCNSSSFRKLQLIIHIYICCYFFVFFYIVCQIQWSSSNFLVLWSILWFDVDKLPVFSEENGAFDILYKSRQTLVDRFYYRPAHAQP